MLVTLRGYRVNEVGSGLNIRNVGKSVIPCSREQLLFPLVKVFSITRP